MLTLARESRGLTQTELGELIGFSHSNINRWEAGFISINPEAFIALQQKLDYPESFFFQVAEIFPPAFYRKRDKVDKRTLDKIEANVNIHRIHFNTLINSHSHLKTAIATITRKEETTPQQIAQAIRKQWKVLKGAMGDLIELVESNGIPVFTFDFETERVDGRMTMTEARHPVIFVNSAHLGDRQRFTLAHELGQMILYKFCTPAYKVDELNHQANLFAAEFLLPEKEIREDLKEPVTLQLLSELKLKWKVSMQSLLYRADDLGLLSYNQKRYLLGQFNQLQIRRREPLELDIPKEKPVLIRELITKYKTQQKMSIKQLAAYFHLTESDFTRRYIN